MAKYDNYKFKTPIKITERFRTDEEELRKFFNETHNEKCMTEKMCEALEKSKIDYVYQAVIERNIEIDREELLRILRGESQQYKQGYEDGYKDGSNDNVIHAHWEDIGTANGHEDISAGVCSACELVSTWFADSREPEKCSHCGAKMDEVVDND